MQVLGFRRSTLVDASVNLVPFAMLVAFLAYFLAYDPWPGGFLSQALAVGLFLVPIVVLLAATAVVARVIGAEEADGEAS